MYYINTQGPNHGNPTSTPFPNSIALPDDLLMDYINTKGFCTITVQDGAVTALEVDQEALDAYNETHPEVEPETPVTIEDLQAENKLLKAQVQAQTDRADFIEDCIAEMAGVVYAAGET
mgnify:CR=1 FL=1